MNGTIKRAMDLAISGGVLAVVGPCYPLVAAAIKLESDGAAIFKHRRLGKFGAAFDILKLRTMRNNAPSVFAADGSRTPITGADPRVTRLGRFLRGGLDELPQFWNVFVGEMSIVGPRPDDLYAANLYDGVEWLKLGAKPGITGLAATSGRNEIPWRDRVKYDVFYVAHASLALDLKIILRTALMAMGFDPTPIADLASIESDLRDPAIVARAAEIEGAIRDQLRDVLSTPAFQPPSAQRTAS